MRGPSFFALSFVTAAMALAACGPGPTPETPVPGADAGSSTSEGGAVDPTKTSSGGSSGGAASSGGASGAGAGGSANKLEANKKGFMDGCTKGTEGTGDFCECAWGELRIALGDAKMGGDGPGERDLIDARPRIMAACKSKMPEAASKSVFMQDCVGPDKAVMETYCECSWTELRKVFSAGDLSDEATVKSEKFSKTRVTVAKTCGAKLPEKLVKDGFMAQCVRDPKLEKLCTCAWDELRKIASPADIHAGTIDKDKITATVEKACSKFKPAK